MAQQQGGWTTFGERAAFDSPWVGVRLVDLESPAGERFEHHVVTLPSFAVAVVVDADDRVLLLWKYRFPVERWGYEAPGGMIEDGEAPVDAAAREAVEETGWRPDGEAEHLFTTDPLPGQVRARAHVYRWRGATRLGEATDPEESHSVVEWVPLERVPALVRDGKMLDPTTAAALLLVHASAGTNRGGPPQGS